LCDYVPRSSHVYHTLELRLEGSKAVPFMAVALPWSHTPSVRRALDITTISQDWTGIACEVTWGRETKWQGGIAANAAENAERAKHHSQQRLALLHARVPLPPLRRLALRPPDALGLGRRPACLRRLQHLLAPLQHLGRGKGGGGGRPRLLPVPRIAAARGGGAGTGAGAGGSPGETRGRGLTLGGLARLQHSCQLQWHSASELQLRS
jgi:hypothetical protein